MQEQKKTEKTKAKKTETIIKKTQNDIRKETRRKERERNLTKQEIISSKGKFNIFAKAKQQLIECENRNCQIKGGNSNLTRRKTTKYA